jgi:hypothetical protein
MSVNGSPRFGCIVDITEAIAASASSSVPTTRPVQLGAAAAPTSPLPAALTPGTGVSAGCNVIIDGLISLAGAATLTIDLTTFTSGGATKSLSKCRGFFFVNTAPAESAAGLAFTVSGTASNGFLAGGNIPPSTAPATLSPAGQASGSNLNIAGWTVDATHKTVIVTAGATGATGYFVFFGE